MTEEPRQTAPRYNAIRLILEFSHACMRVRNQALLEYVQKNKQSVLEEGINETDFDCQVRELEQNLSKTQKELTDASFERGNQFYFDKLCDLTGTLLSPLEDQHKLSSQLSPHILLMSQNGLLTNVFLEKILKRVNPYFSGNKSTHQEEREIYRRSFTQWVRACAVNGDIIQPFGRLEAIGDEIGIKYIPNPAEEQRRNEILNRNQLPPIEKARYLKYGERSLPKPFTS